MKKGNERFASRRRVLPALSVIIGALVLANVFSRASYEAVSFVVELDAALGWPGLTRLCSSPSGVYQRAHTSDSYPAQHFASEHRLGNSAGDRVFFT